MLKRRTFLSCAAAAAGLSVIGASPVAAAEILSAPEARALLADQALILIDIRSREEWQSTGVARGAWPVSLHEAGFGDKLNQIFQRFPDTKIALICATGGRTRRVTRILEANGVTRISDVSEGMMGNRRGAGWIARGFAVVPLNVAMADYTKALDQS